MVSLCEKGGLSKPQIKEGGNCLAGEEMLPNSESHVEKAFLHHGKDFLAGCLMRGHLGTFIWAAARSHRSLSAKSTSEVIFWEAYFFSLQEVEKQPWVIKDLHFYHSGNIASISKGLCALIKFQYVEKYQNSELHTCPEQIECCYITKIVLQFWIMEAKSGLNWNT